jgi:hypothetical protein
MITTSSDITNTRMRTSGLVFVVLMLILGLALAPKATAEVTKLYNATHSLTGNCNVTNADPVPDPGCPADPPPSAAEIKEPMAVDTDAVGDMYVLNGDGSGAKGGTEILVFGADGRYIGGLTTQYLAQSLAVDSTGHLYVKVSVPNGEDNRVFRYDPTVYAPQSGEVSYGDPPVEVFAETSQEFQLGRQMAINPINDHLLIRFNRLTEAGPTVTVIAEFAAAVGSAPNDHLTTSIGEGDLIYSDGPLAVDAAHNRLYVADRADPSSEGDTVIRVFELSAPYAPVDIIDGSTTPEGDFPEDFPWRFVLAADEASGHIFVGDYLIITKKIYELDGGGAYVGTIERPRFEAQVARIAVDNWPQSPNQGFLYVPSGQGSTGHLYAYEPEQVAQPPVVESLSVAGITDDDAVLKAVVNPKGSTTHYAFEYTTLTDFEANGFANGRVAGEGSIAPSSEGVAVSAPALDLNSATSYRFRIRVESDCQPGGCADEEEGGFTTYPTEVLDAGCPNQPLRLGAAAALPDCRGYELVTPANTGGNTAVAPNSGDSWGRFGTPSASPSGENVGFVLFGGLIPGMNGTGGGINGDTFSATRAGSGWQTQLVSPTGEQASHGTSGGWSADHAFLTVVAGAGNSSEGPLLVNGERTSYVRYPDGTYHLAEGTLGFDPRARFRFISPGGSHIIFSTGYQSDAVQLEPAAAPAPVGAIYDRTPDGITHVVSLLPADEPVKEKAVYIGASADGSTVAFRMKAPGPIYLRVDNRETQAVGTAAIYEGFSDDGRYLFFLEGGDLFRWDVQEGSADRLTELGDVRPVNIAKSGTTAYFLSGSTTAPSLYVWHDGSIGFVATVTEKDAEGSDGPASRYGGLGMWEFAVAQDGDPNVDREYRPGVLPSRTTEDGSALLFVSRADLTGFEAHGFAEVYRFDLKTNVLLCVSCSPIEQAPTSDTTLLAYRGINSDALSENDDPSGVNKYVEMPNLSSDGRRAFFETSERLVNRDNDNLTDVYEWEADGKGSCTKPDGCIFLISSGQSGRPNHLFGASASGDDVFFTTADLLVPQDGDETPSIYDARVGGGFPAPEDRAGECLGEACQPAVRPLNDPTPGSLTYQGPGNDAGPGLKCPKGKHKVSRGGKTRCVKRHKKGGKHRKHDRHRNHKSANRNSADGRTH